LSGKPHNITGQLYPTHWCVFRKYFLILAIISSGLLSEFACAQPRFPLPNLTDKKVTERVKESMGRYPTTEMKVKAIAPLYSQMGKSGKYPPHPLECDGGASKSKDITLSAWQFDSESALFGGKNITGSELPTDTFMGCFQPMQRPDLPLPSLPCIPIGLGFEICMDPPPLMPNCCAQDKELLSKGGLPRRFRLLSFFFPPLIPFVGDGCRIPIEKSNRGFKLTHWWPENEIEIHNYGRTVFDPTYECGNEMLQHGKLTDFLKELSASLTAFNPGGSPGGTTYVTGKQAGIPDKLRESPHIGESHWAGIQPGDETFTGEAHVYRTYLDVLTALNHPQGSSTQFGYKRDCRCFYTGLDSNEAEGGGQRKVVNGWTEYNAYLPFWRYYQNSMLLNQKKYEAIGQYAKFNDDSCAFLRAWESKLGSVEYGYQDLYKALGIKPPPNAPPRLREELLRICYKGGGDLFPITGQLVGQFNPLPAAAYLTRRALYMFGKEKIGPPGGQQINFMPPNRRINRFSDADDKMQRIYPLKDKVFASKCFQGHEIPNYLQEKNQDWPTDILEDPIAGWGEAGPNDSPRFVHWNKKSHCMCPYGGKAMGLRYNGAYIACTFISDACEKGDKGDEEDDDEAPLEGFGPGHVPIPIFPDGVPYPFLPKYKTGRYSLDPLRITDPAVVQIPGGQLAPRVAPGGKCELEFNRFPMKLHRRLPEHIVNQFGENDGGIQCDKVYPRCTTSIIPPQ